MVDFQKLYRKCLRQSVLGKSSDELQLFLGNYLIVNDYTVNSSTLIRGYSIQSENCRGFFPKQAVSELSTASGLTYVRKQFRKVDFIIPPFMKRDNLDCFCEKIKTSNDLEKLAFEYFSVFYNKSLLENCHIEIYRKCIDFKDYDTQIQEAIEAYHFGLHHVAITALLPCIEGILRNIGLKVGIDCADHITKNQLVSILEKTKKK